MDKNEYNRLFKIYKKYAERKGYSQHSDDFAQEAIIECFKGSFRTTNQIFIDFLRKQYGDTRHSRSISGHNKSFDGHSNERKEFDFENIAATNNNDLGKFSEPIENYWRYYRFTLREQIILTLFIQDMTLIEIANIFGVSESRISQQIKRIKREIEKTITLRDKLEEYNLNLIPNDFSLNWIEI